MHIHVCWVHTNQNSFTVELMELTASWRMRRERMPRPISPDDCLLVALEAAIVMSMVHPSWWEVGMSMPKRPIPGCTRSCSQSAASSSTVQRSAFRMKGLCCSRSLSAAEGHVSRAMHCSKLLQPSRKRFPREAAWAGLFRNQGRACLCLCSHTCDRRRGTRCQQ